MKKLLFYCLLFFSTSILAQPKHEFRAVWVATVNNIDWPSKPGLSSDLQKKEILEILETCKGLGINAILLQVRPAADAFYPSDLEPWSRYLTGTPGKAPDPFYDPLQLWIEECHKRGIEFHAWLNPFRVAQNAKQTLSGNHVAFQHPEWVIKYGERLYFDPGIPETRDFVVKVVKDIVLRYDVDAIHFDDYFYPYPLAQDFPDTTSFKMYNRGFNLQNKADWRRENVDMIIKNINDSIKAAKPWVKFGISPFGVWRNIENDPEGSYTKAGLTNYDNLFADVIKWQKSGWIDYILPQLYWRIGHPLVDFELLAEWWKNHSFNRALYIGHALYKVNKTPAIQEWTNALELPKQIKLIRNIPEINGSAFYSSNHLKRDLFGFQDSLKVNLYPYRATVPQMKWIDDVPPKAVTSFKKSGKKIYWETEQTINEFDKPIQYIIYINEKNEKFDPENSRFIFEITRNKEFKFQRLNKKKKKYEIRVSVLDRLNNESIFSKPVQIKL